LRLLPPSGGGWIVITSEDFKGRATDWSNNTTRIACAYTTRMLGDCSVCGAGASMAKTFPLLDIRSPRRA
jgi:hypothetical protein